MSNSDFGAKAPKIKDDFKKHQPIAGSKKEAEDLKKRLNKAYEPTLNLTIGGYKEQASHTTNNSKLEERIHQIEAGLDRARKRVQVKSKFNNRSRSRTRTRS